jgi:hypothetical protein
MPIRQFEQRTILLKIETTYGTDASPTGTSDAVLSFEGSVAFEADKLDRKQDRAFFGGDPFVLIGKRAMVEFDFDMIGATSLGTAAPIGPVLRACGHSQTLNNGVSTTYAPVSTGFSAATIYFYINDRLFKLLGARGTIDWNMEVKQFARGKAKFTGIIGAASPSQATPGAVTLTAFQVPPAVETETFLVTANSVTINCIGVSLSQNNDLKMHEGSESREVSIMERTPTGVLRMFDDLANLSTFNPWSLANAHTQMLIEATVDGGTGKITRLQVPNAQLEYPRLVNQDGALVWEIPFVALPSSAGNDEYNFRFT